MHAAENDILALKRDFGFQFANVFDTLRATRILGWRQVGLAAILKNKFGVVLNKRMQRTNWGHRPLTPEQLAYARLDSHYLLPLRDILEAELRACGRWEEALEAFASLPDIEYEDKVFDPEGFWRIHGVRDLSPRELAVLRELYLWREREAQRLDRPPFKVAHNDVLLQLAVRQPRNRKELSRIEGLSPYQISRFGARLLAAVARGQQAPPPAPPERRTHHAGDRPDEATLVRFDALRRWRRVRAERRGVDPDVIFTNDVLMAIARCAPRNGEELEACNNIGTWKRQEYGDEILRVLRETEDLRT
ncbi:MAG TPA: hypothetical protein EYH31_09225, partial [Anaerolineae bacterium]|nr:hypothetical protein [Anaerolineae bacterium]